MYAYLSHQLSKYLSLYAQNDTNKFKRSLNYVPDKAHLTSFRIAFLTEKEAKATERPSSVDIILLLTLISDGAWCVRAEGVL